jgi:uncharacterized OsmC-like protein
LYLAPQNIFVMATTRTIYIGDLRTENVHLQSGYRLITDAPVDNQGKGEAFSPTDLVATALADCILTIMGINARDRDLDLTGTIVETTKVMNPSPRRIAEIIIDITSPQNNFSERDKRVLEAVVKSCPVALSLNPEIKQTVYFHW